MASYLDIHNKIMDEFLDILRSKIKVDEKTGSKSIDVVKFENNLKFLALESIYWTLKEVQFFLIYNI